MIICAVQRLTVLDNLNCEVTIYVVWWFDVLDELKC